MTKTKPCIYSWCGQVTSWRCCLKARCTYSTPATRPLSTARSTPTRTTCSTTRCSGGKRSAMKRRRSVLAFTRHLFFHDSRWSQAIRIRACKIKRQNKCGENLQRLRKILGEKTGGAGHVLILSAVACGKGGNLGGQRGTVFPTFRVGI